MTIHHGIKFTDQTSAARPIMDASTSVIGLIATASDADADYYPANTPVYLDNLTDAIAAAGTKGTLKKALLAITDIVDPVMIVIRVPDTDADPAVASDIVGTIDNDGVATGIQALALSATVTGLTPKILGAPGFTDATVSNALATVGEKLRAFAYFRPDADTISAAVTEMPTYGHKNMMAIWHDTNDWDGDAVARAMALRAKLDSDYGFVHKSISNEVIAGVNSLTKPVSWNISGIGTGAATLNDAKITAIIRNSGFRFWGNRTPSADANFSFETWVRTDYAIKDMIEAAEFPRIDKPLTKNLVEGILSELNAKARLMVSLGQIIGLEFYWNGEINPALSLAAGKARISYKFTPVAPLESLEFLPEITGEYYTGF